MSAFTVKDLGRKCPRWTGEQRDTVTLCLAAEPVSDVAIKSNLAEAIEHNSTVVLTCSSKGSFITFSWINGTAPIVADGKRLTITQVSSRHLPMP